MTKATEPVQEAPNADFVLMHVPKTVRITLPNQSVVTFQPGIQEVPTALADDWYLKANGAKPYVPGELAAQTAPITQHHVEFLQKKGYAVTTVQGAQNLLNQIPPDQRKALLLEAGVPPVAPFGPGLAGAKHIALGQPPTGAQPQPTPVPHSGATTDAEETAEEAPDLNAMTKAQIVEHASEVHGLELDPAMKKDDLIAAVNEHVENKAAESAV